MTDISQSFGSRKAEIFLGFANVCKFEQTVDSPVSTLKWPYLSALGSVCSGCRRLLQWNVSLRNQASSFANRRARVHGGLFAQAYAELSNPRVPIGVITKNVRSLFRLRRARFFKEHLKYDD
uniref:Uncharacterized protein n=1 Tax=Steinernema glaseri TaxID=37863 RepID=A0A1I7ZHL9_9BILA